MGKAATHLKAAFAHRVHRQICEGAHSGKRAEVVSIAQRTGAHWDIYKLALNEGSPVRDLRHSTLIKLTEK